MRDFLRVHRGLKYSSLKKLSVDVIENYATHDKIEHGVIELDKNELIEMLFNYAYDVSICSVKGSIVDLIVYIEDKDKFIRMEFEC